MKLPNAFTHRPNHPDASLLLVFPRAPWVQAKMPKKPLELWGYEASPFTKVSHLFVATESARMSAFFDTLLAVSRTYRRVGECLLVDFSLPRSVEFSVDACDLFLPSAELVFRVGRRDTLSLPPLPFNKITLRR